MKKRLIALSLMVAVALTATTGYAFSLNLEGFRKKVVETVVKIAPYLYLDRLFVNSMAEDLTERYDAKAGKIPSFPELVSNGQYLVYEGYSQEAGIFSCLPSECLDDELEEEVRRDVYQFLFSDEEVLPALYGKHVERLLDRMQTHTEWDSWRKDRASEMFLLYQEEVERVTFYLEFASTHTSAITEYNEVVITAENDKRVKLIKWNSAGDISEKGFARCLYYKACDVADEKQNAFITFIRDEGGAPKGWNSYQLILVAQFFERRRQEGADFEALKVIAEDFAHRLGEKAKEVGGIASCNRRLLMLVAEMDEALYFYPMDYSDRMEEIFEECSFDKAFLKKISTLFPSTAWLFRKVVRSELAGATQERAKELYILVARNLPLFEEEGVRDGDYIEFLGQLRTKSGVE